MEQALKNVKHMSNEYKTQMSSMLEDLQDHLQGAYIQLKKEKKELDKEKKLLEEEKIRFNNMTQKIQEFHTVDGIVSLDIGGYKCSVSLKRLQSLKDSFFSAMFSGSWTLHPQTDGSYFIDRDGTNFHYILTYIRDKKLPMVDDVVYELLQEAEFYQLRDLIAELSTRVKSPVPLGPFSHISVDSLIIKPKDVFVINQFSEKFQNVQWNLLYRATRDGFRGADFHTACDGMSPTIVIIKTKEQNVFGGVSFQPWSSNGTWTYDPDAFLFTLVNPHKIPPTKYCIKQYSQATFGKANYGPSFGDDLYIADCSNQNSHSFTKFPKSYYPDIEGKHGKGTFNGTKHFYVSQIEVFTVTNC